MDNLMKIILIVLVTMMLLNYSCGKTEGFGIKSSAITFDKCDTKCKKNKKFSNKISNKICKSNKDCKKAIKSLKFCKSNGKNKICPDNFDKSILYRYNDCSVVETGFPMPK